jgi:hypothetical protein
MASFDDVKKAAEHLRLRHETAQAPLAGFIVLLAASGASYAYRRAETAWWIPVLAGLLILGPWCLNRILPARNTTALRLSILAYPLNILLLAFVAYREVWRVDFPDLEELPQLSNALDWSAPLIPFVYAYLQFPGWLRRIRLLPQLKAMATLPPDPLVLREVQELGDLALQGEATAEGAPAQFRTISATPRNWRLFLKPDLFKHGVWKVGFTATYALVLFEDGGREEAVRKGGLKMVAADPKEGAASVSCLVRWNDHLHEGVVDVESFQRIQGWNAPPQ